MSDEREVIPMADEVCELLARSPGPTERALLTRLLADASAGAVLAEVGRRGLAARLLPDVVEPADTEPFRRALAVADDLGLFVALAQALCQRQRPGDRPSLEALVLSAEAKQLLGPLFAALIEGGQYDPLRELLCEGGIADSPALRALAARRPSYDADQLNAAALAELHRYAAAPDAYPFDLLIVPGYTPPNAERPLHLRELPPARLRVEQAARDFLDGKAPFVLCTGGSVHPAGTPHNEALCMREHLLDNGVSADRILIDPWARHTTTNLRNAGRVMLAHGLGRGLIVTGFESDVFSQAFYLALPELSTFALRCRNELGYTVGDLEGVDDHHIAFTPDPACATVRYSDPWDT